MIPVVGLFIGRFFWKRRLTTGPALLLVSWLLWSGAATLGGLSRLLGLLALLGLVLKILKMRSLVRAALGVAWRGLCRVSRALHAMRLRHVHHPCTRLGAQITTELTPARSVKKLPCYQDEALLQRAWAQPVAKQYEVCVCRARGCGKTRFPVSTAL